MKADAERRSGRSGSAGLLEPPREAVWQAA
jgi:hypothetical protein